MNINITSLPKLLTTLTIDQSTIPHCKPLNKIRLTMQSLNKILTWYHYTFNTRNHKYYYSHCLNHNKLLSCKNKITFSDEGISPTSSLHRATNLIIVLLIFMHQCRYVLSMCNIIYFHSLVEEMNVVDIRYIIGR